MVDIEDRYSLKELKRIRYKVAEFIKYIIRARLTQEPQFLPESDLDRWEVPNLHRKGHPTASLLNTAFSLYKPLNEDFLHYESGGFPEEYADDPLQELRELVAHFAETLVHCRETIQQAKSGEPVNWDELAQWDTLKEIRDELDRLPTPAAAAKPDGFDRESRCIRWKGHIASLPVRLYDLVTYLWRREHAQVDDVIETVWGEMAQEQTLRSALSRLNNLLTEIQHPWSFHIHDGVVRRRDRNQSQENPST